MHFIGQLSLFLLYKEEPTQEHVDLNIDRDLEREHWRVLCGESMAESFLYSQ